MKFGEQLEAALRPKWRAYYVHYRGLKERLEEVQANPSLPHAHFVQQLKSQLIKVTRFYFSTESRLWIEAESLTEPSTPDSSTLSTASTALGASRRVLERRALERAALEREAEALRTFAALNVEALRKIAKKFDKAVGPGSGGAGLQADVLESLRSSQLADAEARIGELLAALRALREPLLHEGGSGLLGSPTPRVTQAKVPLLRGATSKVFAIFEKYDQLPPPKSNSTFSVVLPPTSSWSQNVAMMPAVSNLAVPVILAAFCLSLERCKASEQLDWRSYVSIFITLQALVLLLTQNPPDVVLLMATLVLRVAGILDDAEAWGGFSNEVVLSVAVLGVVSAGVHHTGVVEHLFMRILGRPKSYAMAMLRLCIPAMVMNSAISNTCIMGVIVPVIERWSCDLRMHPALFLMPMSYLLLISGTVTIFATSSNLIAQGLLISKDEKPFGNFDPLLLGGACSVVTLLYLMLAVPVLLRRFMAPSTTDAASHEAGSAGSGSAGSAGFHDLKLFVAAMQVTGTGLDGRTLAESGLPPLLSNGLADIVRLERMAIRMPEVGPETVLHQYDVIYVWTTTDAIMTLMAFPQVSFIALDGGWEHNHSRENRGFVEVVLDGLCPLIGKKLASTKELEATYAANCLAIRPCNMQHFQKPQAQAEEVKSFLEGLRHAQRESSYCLSVGDNLLLDVPRNFVATYRNSAHFTLVVERSQVDKDDDGEASGQTAKSRWNMCVSGLILLGLVALVATNAVTLLEAALMATFALVATGCLPQQSAFNAIKIRTILTIVGAFGIGKAMGKTRVANVLAVGLCRVLAPFGSTGIYGAVFAATVALGVVFHATAVVILMFPICEEVSVQQGVRLHRVVAVLMMGAGCQMLSPISYQTNLMAYASGHYRFNDFAKVGVGAVLLIGTVTVSMVDYLI